MESLKSFESIRTRCPNCQTVFEIDGELATSEDTRVRCGECYSVFDAHENILLDSLPDDLLFEGEASASPDLSATDALDDHDVMDDSDKIVFEPDDAVDDQVYEFSNADLFSDAAELPEVSYLEENEEIPELDFNAIDPDDEQFDGTLFDDVQLTLDEEPEALTDITADEFLTPLEDADPVASTDLVPSADASPFTDAEVAPDFGADSTTPSEVGFFSRRVLMLVILALGLGSLYVYADRTRLQQSSLTRPLVSVVCAVAGCELASANHLDQLLVIRRNVYTHPTVGDALIINIVFRNQATVAQAYPRLAISMSDIMGKVVAERVFQPHEYLQQPPDVVLEKIQADQTVEVSLEVKDPGDQAKSFELEFH